MPQHKVLVVDDSALMRRLLTQLLKADGYEVVTAGNGEEAVQCLLREQPDVVTLDINMPRMDGLTALSLMMAARATPTIMVSSLTAQGALATLEALALGAVDYIEKPGGTISLSIDEIAAALSKKIRTAIKSKPRLQPSISRTQTLSANVSIPKNTPQPALTLPAGDINVVLIGVSTGGPRTLEDILPLLPADLPAAVVIAQHMPANFTQTFAQRMDRVCPMPVREVDAPMPLMAGHVYVGKGGTDVVVTRRLGRLVVMPMPESAQHLWHPSVDVMVSSAMQCVSASRLIGVQLTGMGNDGAASMAQLKQAGGKTIAESQETAVVFGMPHELIQRGGASVVLPAHSVAQQLRSWMQT